MQTGFASKVRNVRQMQLQRGNPSQTVAIQYHGFSHAVLHGYGTDII
ncbi:MAG: hypothetical protein U1E92_04240 [Moraxella osloensis]